MFKRVSVPIVFAFFTLVAAGLAQAGMTTTNHAAPTEFIDDKTAKVWLAKKGIRPAFRQAARPLARPAARPAKPFGQAARPPVRPTKPFGQAAAPRRPAAALPRSAAGKNAGIAKRAISATLPRAPVRPAVSRASAQKFAGQVRPSRRALAAKPLTRARIQKTRDALKASAPRVKKPYEAVFGKGGQGGLIKNIRTSLSGTQIGQNLSNKRTRQKRWQNRVVALVKRLSNNARRGGGLNQRQFDTFKRIVGKAGGSVRVDGTSGQKGSSAGVNHAQVEGAAFKGIRNKHIWLQPGVR